MLNGRAHHYQYLFFGGILGEILELPFVGNYLKENREILKDLGLRHVHYHNLSSLKSAHVNAKLILKYINNYYRQSKRPIIIFCHSKGCLEVLLAMGMEIESFRKYVHKVICVQPPFQGASVTEIAILKQVGAIWPGLACLNKHYYSTTLHQELVKDPIRNNYLNENVLVIKGHHPIPAHISWIIRPSHFLLKEAGANDGLVHLKDQVIPDAKYREITIEMDHSDLFTSNLLSNKATHFRRELMIKVINWSVGIESEKEKSVEELLMWAALHATEQKSGIS